MDVGNLISDSSAFSKSSWTYGSSWFIYCWSLAWRILSITLLACEMSAIVWQFEHSLALSFFGIGRKTDFFQACGHCWVFQICWHNECSTFTASSFRIWQWNLSSLFASSFYPAVNHQLDLLAPPLKCNSGPAVYHLHSCLNWDCRKLALPFWQPQSVIF